MALVNRNMTPAHLTWDLLIFIIIFIHSVLQSYALDLGKGNNDNFPLLFMLIIT